AIPYPKNRYALDGGTDFGICGLSVAPRAPRTRWRLYRSVGSWYRLCPVCHCRRAWQGSPCGSCSSRNHSLHRAEPCHHRRPAWGVCVPALSHRHVVEPGAKTLCRYTADFRYRRLSGCVRRHSGHSADPGGEL
ncbi:MAG: Na(+) H(+) antiporter subunit B, partial [Olavius algarvensis Delta 4 endosymbiont]